MTGDKMIMEQGKRYRLMDTGDTRLLGNYQVVDCQEKDTKMPYVFDSYEDALSKFNKLEKEENEQI
jgi:hypothetical protein